MADIFISYSRNDRDRVRYIAKALEAEGLDVWWDPDIPPGESFSQVIDRQLKQAACIIVVWSDSSGNSNWVQEEADDGMMRNTLVPVMIDEIDLPRGFKRLQTADLRDWTGDTRDPNWQLIIAQVRKLVAGRRADAAAETQAESRTRRAPPASAPRAQHASEPQAQKKKSGGFPIIPALLGVVAIGAGAYYFLTGDKDAPETSREASTPATVDVADAQSSAAPAGDTGDSTGSAQSAAPSAAESGGDGLTLGPPPSTVPQAGGQSAADEPVSIKAEEPAPEPAAQSPEPQPVATTAYAPGEKFRDCESCPELVVIPAGSFEMGAAEGERNGNAAERPVHTVTFAQPFAIGVFEVTHDEWAACLADGGCNGVEPRDSTFGRGRRPVINLNYDDAQAYLSWLSDKTGETYRLPSEAEWEYAARAGAGGPFSFGDSLSSNDANFNGDYPYHSAPQRFRNQTLEVGSFKPNAFGLYDVHGNVWEWTADCWRPNHEGAPTDGSAVGGSCSQRTVKGGAWNAGGWRLRSAHRLSERASRRDSDIGFRVLREM